MVPPTPPEETRALKVVAPAVVNNVVYNWGTDAYIEGDSAGRSDANVVNNYFVKGPLAYRSPGTNSVMSWWNPTRSPSQRLPRCPPRTRTAPCLRTRERRCRDSIDRRVVASAGNETGAIITDPAGVGGFGNRAGDGNDIGPDGYSNVERYLNGLVP